MEFRYMGFEQTPTRRLYKFDGTVPKGPSAHFVVSVDLDLFLRNHVNIQEGPSLCALKLKADLDAQFEGEHELTNGDLAAFVAGRTADAARKAEARKPGQRRRKPEAGQPVSPWWR
jgi:hypothetical protein